MFMFALSRNKFLFCFYYTVVVFSATSTLWYNYFGRRCVNASNATLRAFACLGFTLGYFVCGELKQMT